MQKLSNLEMLMPLLEVVSVLGLCVGLGAAAFVAPILFYQLIGWVLNDGG